MRLRLPTAYRAVATFVLALAFIVSSAVPSLAVGGLTGNLAGTIIDAGTKAPISGAAVTAVSPTSHYSARTDARGYFQINGMTVDTYNVSITAPGFDVVNVNGVTIQGDNTVDLQTVTLAKTLQKIGRTAVRSQSSAFQPSQTTDAVSVSGARVQEALGKSASTSETALALSIPGVQLTNAGRLTIRGGLANEVGYQLDGVNFTEPFLNTNASTNRFNGLGSLQVVAGAGDASQGNVGGGVVNVVIKRGSRPPFGYLDFETGAPNFSHQAAAEYGFATPNGRFSNYISFVAQRYNSYAHNPAYGIPSEEIGQRFGSSYIKNDDVVDNFVYRFGKDQRQSLQVLYQTRDAQAYGGDPTGRHYYPYDAYSQRGITGPLSPDPTTVNGNVTYGGFPSPAAFFANKVYLLAGVPTTDVAPVLPEELAFSPARFMKFEYNNSLNDSTFFALRAYNWEVDNGGTAYLSSPTRPTDAITGGQRVGLSGELTKSFGEKHTAQVGFLVENAHPYWSSAEPYSGYNSVLAYGGDPGQAALTDFVNPANVNAPISASNPCPVGVDPVNAPAGDPTACYLYRTGQFYGTGVGRVPSFGINYNQTDLQQFGLFAQDTFSPNRFLKAQFGLREDVGNFKQGRNPLNPTDLANPDDVDPAMVSGFFTQPHYLEPRASLTYSNRDSAIRLGYGRSVEFPEAQTFGTPSAIVGLDPRMFQVAAKGNTSDPTTWSCGSGYNPKWLPPGQDALTAPNGGVNSPYGDGGLGGMFQCSTYAQQLYWLYDQQNDAPDLGGNKPTSQSNTDLSLQHQFRNGFGVRLTGYYRHGFDVPNLLLLKQILDPVTGAPVVQVFGVANKGITKTTGLEFGLTSPQRAFGLSGYLSATYTNALSTVPPLISGEDNVPLVSSSSVALGNMFRSGFVSPFVVNAGAQYKWHNGFRINPVLNYDRGYPIGVGTLTATGGRIGNTINGLPYNIPQTNLGLAQPAQVAANGSAGAVAATSYVDPVNPGNYFHPYIDATRGTPETSAAGGYLSRPRATLDTSFEYQRGRNIWGMQLTNMFGNIYSEPALNPYWQPVATGVGGPNTGKNAAGYPTSTAYVVGGFRNYGPLRYGSQPYVEYPNQAPLGIRLYYQLQL